jgi:hypothetical protein
MAVLAVSVANCSLARIRAGKDGGFATAIVVTPFDPPVAGGFPILKNPCVFGFSAARPAAGPAYFDNLVLNFAAISTQNSLDLRYREPAHEHIA